MISPAFHAARCDFWLGQMIDNHRQIGQGLGQRYRMPQMLDEEEQVKRNLVLFEDPQPAKNLRSNNKIVVILIVGNVANTNEFCMLFECAHLLLTIFAF